MPMPPLWAVLLTQAFGTMVVSLLVFLLLLNIQNQREAMRELNHGLRNALQVIAYVVPTCAAETRNQAKDAMEQISETLHEISDRLGGNDLGA